MVFLDFKPILFSGQELSGVPVPDHSDTIVLWDDESAGEIAGRLEASLERLNLPPDKFSFKYALDRLVRSVDVMRQARGAGSDSPLRLEGRLRLFINDEWILTDWGLEAVSTSDRFKGEHGVVFPAVSNGFDGKRHLRAVFVPPEQRTATAELVEALAWMRDRERVSIEAPDEERGPIVRRL
jgi:hypothetical protein